MSIFKPIPIANIIIPEDRTRGLDRAWVELLAENISEQGLINPISVWPKGDGQYELITGFHRLAAVTLIAEKDDDDEDEAIYIMEAEIVAHIREYKSENVDHILLEEVSENLFRNELNALDRAHSLFDLDGVYKRLYPALKQGGNKQTREARENLTAILAVRSDLMERVVISDRSFQRSIAIWKGLSRVSRINIPGTWLASHQAGLMQLSEVGPKEQSLVLEILFDEESHDYGKAKTVTDALNFIHGKRVMPSNEKRIRSTQSNLAQMNRSERISVLGCFEEEIKEIAQMKGWI